MEINKIGDEKALDHLIIPQIPWFIIVFFPSADVLEPRYDELNEAPLWMEANWKHLTHILLFFRVNGYN